MEAHVQKRTENKPLNRDEVECIVNFEEGTPKVDEVKALIAKVLVANPDLVVINKLLQQFGMKQTKVIACVYKTPEAMGKIVKKKKEEAKPAQ